MYNEEEKKETIREIEKLCEVLNNFKQGKKYQTISSQFIIHSINDFLQNENKTNHDDLISLDLKLVFQKYPDFNLEKLCSYDFCHNYCLKYLDSSSEINDIKEGGI